jgi:hypothetical protein
MPQVSTSAALTHHGRRRARSINIANQGVDIVADSNELHFALSIGGYFGVASFAISMLGWIGCGIFAFGDIDMNPMNPNADVGLFLFSLSLVFGGFGLSLSFSTIGLVIYATSKSTTRIDWACNVMAITSLVAAVALIASAMM